MFEVFVALQSDGSEVSRKLLVPFRHCIFCSEGKPECIDLFLCLEYNE